ncbi:MAG: septation protein SpoVG family protein [Planctomycetaceae bacterium]|jgi:stage V sporulation protein G|nr:septation protein SpoVG family protein [Planctomycetaceae bacterium]MCE2815096.1 septation protein SpoVG family protein [Planctomycetaceae bacterium]
MDITEVRIKLMEDSEDRLRAFCSITFDHAFVVRDLKIIEGTNGPFVAMPSRKMTARCGRCGSKNHMRSNYCNQCGKRLRGAQDLQDIEGASNKLYADIAHPINQACRDQIQQAVIGEYYLELERAKDPGYVSRYDEEYLEYIPHAPAPPSAQAPIPRPHMFDKPTQKDVAEKEVAEKEVAEETLKPPENPFGNGIF